MFRSNQLLPVYKNLLGWRQFFNDSIVLPTELTTTESGEYYQDKSGALRLDYIKATLMAGQNLNDYLEEKVKAGMDGMFNDILQYRQVSNYGKTLLEQAQLLNRAAYKPDRIMNEGRFVGFQIAVRDVTALQLVINEIGLQLGEASELKLYLYHSQVEDPIQTLEIVHPGGAAVKWVKTNPEWNLNAISPELFHGGVFMLGYYQSDLSTQAINYSNFDWSKGECSGCNNSYYATWSSIRKHFFVYPFYVPEGSFIKEKRFDMDKMIWSNTQSWGLNLKLTVRCDLTEFFIQNRFAFKNLLAIKVAHIILNDMKYCQETSYIEENLKMMIIRDLEGDKETNALNISQQYTRELKAVNFNIQGINNRCLDCKKDALAPQIGVM